MKRARQLAPLLIFGLFVFGYVQPWVINGSAALNLNGYDLAEWTSLHPAAQAQTPPLLTALLLRLPLACAALWLGWNQPYTGRTCVAATIGLALTAISLLPPVEFLSQRDNPNYQQQAGLAILMLVMGLTGLLFISRKGRRIRAIVSVSALIIGVGAGLSGLLQAVEWMREFQLPAVTGLGAWITMLSFGVVAAGKVVTSLHSSLLSGQSP